jgi:hypothetical protein
MGNVTLPSYFDGNVTIGARGRRSCDVDRVIGALAGRQHGIVTRAQLVRAGVTVGAIEHRVRAGRLIVVHRGVYAPGHDALSDLARVQAALLIGGGGASDWTAAALLGLTPSMPPFSTSRSPADARGIARRCDSTWARRIGRRSAA